MNIPLFKVLMSPDVDGPLSEVLHSGHITQGNQVEKFEEKLKEWFGYPYLLTVNSATSGLTLAYRLLNLKPGDEVASTPLTCFASQVPILTHGLKIKWIDTDPSTCNMSLDDLRKHLTSRVKAVTFVHWGGNPIDLDKLKSITKDIPIIEDCAHAFGAEYKGIKLGAHVGKSGNIAVFSLQAIKHLTTGDGGLIFLPTRELYQRAKLLRWYGIDRQYRSVGDFRLEHDIVEWGYKFHMNDINATIGLANLPLVRDALEIARSNARYYQEHLGNLPGISLLETSPQSAYWLYTIRVIDKPGFIQFMKEKGIMVSQVHHRNDTHSCLQEFKRQTIGQRSTTIPTKLPKLDMLEQQIVSIPVGWWVGETEREYIVQAVREWSQNLSVPLWITTGYLETDDYFRGYLALLAQLNNYREPISYEQFREQYDKIKRNSGIILVFRIDEKVVATGKLLIEHKFYSKLGHIEDIVVDRECRGRGLGVRLVKELLAIAKDKGCYKVVLEAGDKLERFYQKVGMIKEGIEMVCRFKIKDSE